MTPTKNVSAIIAECENKIEAEIGKKVKVTYHLQCDTITEEKLVRIIEEVTGVTWKDIIHKTRCRDISLPRQLYCYYAYNLLYLTNSAICKRINRTNHTTVLHCRKQIANLISAKDELVIKLTNNIEAAIYNIVKNQNSEIQAN